MERLLGEADLRGIDRVPLSPINEGRFGRMFRRLPPLPPYPDDVLKDLANLCQVIHSPKYAFRRVSVGAGGSPKYTFRRVAGLSGTAYYSTSMVVDAGSLLGVWDR